MNKVVSILILYHIHLFCGSYEDLSRKQQKEILRTIQYVPGQKRLNALVAQFPFLKAPSSTISFPLQRIKGALKTGVYPEKMMRTSCAAGIPIDQIDDEDGESTLMIFASGTAYRHCKELQQDKPCNTLKLIQGLLKHRADPTKKRMKDGCTAVDLALRVGTKFAAEGKHKELTRVFKALELYVDHPSFPLIVDQQPSQYPVQVTTCLDAILDLSKPYAQEVAKPLVQKCFSRMLGLREQRTPEHIKKCLQVGAQVGLKDLAVSDSGPIKDLLKAHMLQSSSIR